MKPTPDLSTPFDIVIIGSGIAGLYAALRAATMRRVLLITKEELQESNTRYAQGGVAVAWDESDSPELHLRDTIAAGDGLCDPAQVAVLTRQAVDCISELVRLGVPFDRDQGGLARTLEAAHSVPRVVHAGGDATGASIEATLATLVRSAGVTILENCFCVEIITRNGRAAGVNVLLNDGTGARVAAHNIILAAGGAGRLYSRTTNPPVATGDGVAMAFRAGAELMDLEFVQFHPTALAVEGAPPFLISEAARGEGGILRGVHSHAFMSEYHLDRELAPRDVVARSIHDYMQRTDTNCVYLDLTHLAAEHIQHRFPSIFSACRNYGVDITREPIPVAPAAHYWMGGVRTDSWGGSSVPGLYACGEVACTGVHGANRLASNSLLEGLVFAHRVVQHIAEQQNGNLESRAGFAYVSSLPSMLDREGPPNLSDTMWRDAGLVRSEESLSRVRHALYAPAASFDAQVQGDPAIAPSSRRSMENKNLSLLSKLLVESALARRESRGAHFRSDYPESDPSWQAHTVVSGQGIWRAPLEAAPDAALQRA